LRLPCGVVPCRGSPQQMGLSRRLAGGVLVLCVPGRWVVCCGVPCSFGAGVASSGLAGLVRVAGGGCAAPGAGSPGFVLLLRVRRVSVALAGSVVLLLVLLVALCPGPVVLPPAPRCFPEALPTHRPAPSAAAGASATTTVAPALRGPTRRYRHGSPQTPYAGSTGAGPPRVGKPQIRGLKPTFPSARRSRHPCGSTLQQLRSASSSRFRPPVPAGRSPGPTRPKSAAPTTPPTTPNCGADGLAAMSGSVLLRSLRTGCPHLVTRPPVPTPSARRGRLRHNNGRSGTPRTDASVPSRQPATTVHASTGAARRSGMSQLRSNPPRRVRSAGTRAGRPSAFSPPLLPSYTIARARWSLPRPDPA
jgi:hypothetical protein